MCRGYCKTAQRGKIHQAQNNIAYFMAHYENTRARLECAGGMFLGRLGGEICATFTQKRFRKCAEHGNPIPQSASTCFSTAHT